jgi:chromosome segregation ATPase
VQRAFQREFEQVSALADQVPALSEKSAALQALISDREAQLTAIGAQAQESAARAAATLAELEHQKAAYADLVEQRDVLARSAEDMRSEIARLSEAVAAAQLREDELERIRKQVAALREAVMQAERKAREHATVEAVIRADMADAIQAFHGRSEQVEILKSELAHARELGRATLQALAASRLAAAYREPRLGWRQSLRRLFGSARGS